MQEDKNTEETQVADSDIAPEAASKELEGSVDGDIDDALEEEAESYDEAEQRAAELSEEERVQRIQVLKPIVEGALMAAGATLKLNKIQSLFDELERPSKGLLIEALEHIQADCDGRGFALVEVATGWRFQVREDYAPWVNRLWEEKPQKYSRALLETLALVAYRQPMTRGDIEEVRGVAVSSHIMKTLTEREWVKVVGHRDVPGRPALYATTKQFLDYFNMKSLDELPSLGELQDIESLNASLEFDATSSPQAQGTPPENADLASASETEPNPAAEEDGTDSAEGLSTEGTSLFNDDRGAQEDLAEASVAEHNDSEQSADLSSSEDAPEERCEDDTANEVEVDKFES